MICEKCGAAVPDGWPSCLDCGAPMTGSADSKVLAPGVEGDVFPLLASANLSRIRGSYEEAERKCVEILRHYPNNAPAHSLLGEIYEDQGRYSDAVTWYQLALELDPTNEADRSLLSRAMQRQTAAEQQDNQPELSRTGRWWRSSFSNVSRGQWLMIGMLSVACAVLFSYLIFVIYLRGPRSAKTGGILPANPDVSRTPSPASHAASPAGETSEEQSLQQTMNASPRPGVPVYMVDNVLLDPRFQGYAHVTVSIAPPLTPGNAQAAVLQVAGAAGQAAGAANLSSLTLRIQGTIGTAAPSLLFVAEMSPGALNGINPASLTVANSTNLFQHTWWSNYIPGS